MPSTPLSTEDPTAFAGAAAAGAAEGFTGAGGLSGAGAQALQGAEQHALALAKEKAIEAIAAQSARAADAVAKAQQAAQTVQQAAPMVQAISGAATNMPPATPAPLAPRPTASQVAAALAPVQVGYEVFIDGKAIMPVFSIAASQAIGCHERVALELPLRAVEGAQKADTLLLDDLQKSLLGRVAIVIIKNENNADAPRFEGRYIIGEVGLEHRFGAEATIVLTAYSPTWALDGAPHFESFYKKPLKDISSALCNKTLEQFGAQLNASPTFASLLGYTSCFGESSWAYLCRLAAETGQWLYYRGQELIFGQPGQRGKPIALAYGGNCHELTLKASAAPVQASVFDYQPGEDAPLSHPATKESGGAGSYSEASLKKSIQLFGAHPAHALASSLTADKAVIEAMAKARAASAAAGMYTLSGGSSLFALALGSIVQVSLGRVGVDEKVESHTDMRIVKVHHYLDCGASDYHNTFEAVSASATAPPAIPFERYGLLV